ncbi:hypothetical protein GNIT_0192 [Glaciecola nitratireducens FR1064]|uniref:DUF4174 domain-containing protein n=2 Tax=Brumicola TaxID=3160924 RepID=G4QJ07_GLANF|nr:hypothetical protein GNIT_0192 [Glaciecola nitratireducens FR1064]
MLIARLSQMGLSTENHMNNIKLIAASLLLSLCSLETVGAIQQENSASLFAEERPLEELPLETLIWQNRVLIVDAKTPANADILAKQFEARRNQMWDRRLIALLLVDDSVIELRFTQENMETFSTSASQSRSNNQQIAYSVSELRKRLNGKQSILIGLDGGTKSAFTLSSGRIDIEQVFADIDGMPMRKAR